MAIAADAERAVAIAGTLTWSRQSSIEPIVAGALSTDGVGGTMYRSVRTRVWDAQYGREFGTRSTDGVPVGTDGVPVGPRHGTVTDAATLTTTPC
eukprot:834953-Rhodomonas_salina.1